MADWTFHLFIDVINYATERDHLGKVALTYAEQLVTSEYYM